MIDRRFGAAGERLVIEECLSGPEVSFFVLCDGDARAADWHRRRITSESSTTIAGRTPAAWARSRRVRSWTPRLKQRVMREIVDPVLAGMAAEGHPFRGFLYVGLMLTADGPKVIEFNVRLGDPEAQVILPLIDEPLAAAARGCGAAGCFDSAPCALSARRARRRRARLARLSGVVRIRPTDHRHRRRRKRLPGVGCLSRRHGAARTVGSSPPAVAC